LFVGINLKFRTKKSPASIAGIFFVRTDQLSGEPAAPPPVPLGPFLPGPPVLPTALPVVPPSTDLPAPEPVARPFASALLVLPDDGAGWVPGGTAEPVCTPPVSGFTGPVLVEAAKAEPNESESRPASNKLVVFDFIMVRLQFMSVT
jgi:hypothetical protein